MCRAVKLGLRRLGLLDLSPATATGATAVVNRVAQVLEAQVLLKATITGNVPWADLDPSLHKAFLPFTHDVKKNKEFFSSIATFSHVPDSLSIQFETFAKATGDLIFLQKFGFVTRMDQLRSTATGSD